MTELLVSAYTIITKVKTDLDIHPKNHHEQKSKLPTACCILYML
ncbi:hypothetical protein [Paenibacillus alvei]|nr:hypothetical protein [Paenibacillus alvei]